MFDISLLLLCALQQPPAFRAEVRVVRVDAEVRQELRSIDGLRYTLHYAMPDGKPGKQRKIEVKLTPDAQRRYSGAKVYARNGYVVPDT